MKFFTIFVLSFFFVQLSFSDTCTQYFVSHAQYLKKINKVYSAKLNSSGQDVFNKLSIDEKSKFIKFSKKLNNARLKELQKVINSEPEIFLREGRANINKLTIEAYNPGYARKSYKNHKGFKPNSYTYPFEIPEFKKGLTITAEEKKYRKAMIEINKLFKEQKTVFKRMQEFEDEIIARSLKENKKFYKLDERAQASIKQDKMIEVLDELEESHGFVSNSSKKYVALNLENKGYGLEEWQQMLTEGKIFNDTAFKNVENAIDLSSRNGHGYFTHRIQFHILMQEMNKNPARFQDFKAVDLYKKIGDTEFNQKMGLANNGGDTLWQQLFDSTAGGSYHRPEFFREMHELYPALGAWL